MISKMRKKQNVTQTVKAYGIIKRGILKGEFQEGTFLSEKEIERRYGIGRTPFREACNRLHHEKLLEAVPRRGYFVTEVSLRSVREIYEARLLLEGQIAEIAARQAKPGEIEELEHINKTIEAQRDLKNDPNEWVLANTKFHLSLAKMTGNREIVRLATYILEQAQRFMYLELRSSPARGFDPFRFHAPIIQALHGRDPVAAHEAVRNDIIHGRIQVFSRDGQTGAQDDAFWPVR